MSRFHSYINTSLQLLHSYQHQQPFHLYLKDFFSKEKKYGSGDRKQIANICYSFFRTAHAFNKSISADNLLKACLLCNSAPALIQNIQPDWAEAGAAAFAKAGIADHPVFFPWQDRLSNGVDYTLFNASFREQALLFIRIRPGFEKKVTDKLQQAGISFQLVSDHCISLPAATKLQDLFLINKEVIIQDFNSQKSLDFLKSHSFPQQLKVWDCCAASGGKSLLASDHLGKSIQLTVSDIRSGSLHNLSQRFKEAGVLLYNSFVADCSATDFKAPAADYDLVICDAPCTGSGTWGRTPEELFYFDPASIAAFSERQQQIALNTIRALKSGGIFIYITCSVFREENEQVAAAIAAEGYEQLEMKLLPGYEQKADSMFTAIFRKP